MPVADPRMLKPNSWNPNHLSEKQMRRYVQELRKDGINRKSVRVRQVGDALEIVDGEQTVRAAIDAGLSEIVYEMDGEIDTFEAMRRTWTANLHGENDPVKLGYMIREMQSLRPELSQAGLAELLNVTQGTISNRLAYAALADKAATDRTLPPVSEISRMSVREVRQALAGTEGGEVSEEDTRPKTGPRPIEQAKKAFAKLSVDEQTAFLEWARG